MAEPTTLLILGASGDLTRRLLLPGLGSLLAVEGDRRVRVVGADRSEMGEDDWRARVREALEEAGAAPATVDALVGSTRYVRGDVLDPETLRELVGSLAAPLVVYFALPPAVTVQVCALLEHLELPEDTRLALEKPFGHDGETAAALNAQLQRVVPEERIHRVDHFLGIHSVLNLIGLRFSNRLLEPVWSNRHIERVHITYDESLALEGRAGYYDKAGALVDMIQSHLLQVLALFAMEAPRVLDAEEVRSLKAQVLRATELWGRDPVTASRRGRYTAGRVGDRDIPDYVDEEGVDPSLDTETLAQVVVEVRNSRWSGVPFILRSGKALREVDKQIEVVFQPPRLQPKGLHDTGLPDRLLLELRPGAVTFDLSMNAEGDPFELEQKHLHAELGKPRMTPYGEVLGSILDGDQLLSIRGDMAEECWRIVAPVLEAWRENRVPLEPYPAGSAGPEGWDVIPGLDGEPQSVSRHSQDHPDDDLVDGA
ncbi:MAG TPA: glucose-6-phosphate dehydrogenase [Ornithinicoccus sp.]|nr:glucose-6-phosphate dehydrogenase [Ornithinicoccus sp.]